MKLFSIIALAVGGFLFGLAIGLPNDQFYLSLPGGFLMGFFGTKLGRPA